jgi:MFS family permease
MLHPGGHVGGRGEALRRCWSNRRLRRALTAYLLFNVNEWATWIALLVWAYAVHGVRGASVIAVVQLVPAALFASVAAGWLARMRAPRALLLGYAAQTVTTGVTAAAILVGAPFVAVCVVAAVANATICLTRPVHNALLPEVSETTAEVTAANAASGSVEAVAILLGPLLSGAISAWWDPGGVLVVMAVGSALSAWCAAGLGPGVPRVAAPREAGTSPLRVVLRDPAARLLTVLVGAEYVLLGTLDILLVVLALDVLDMSAGGPGLLNSALGIGGVAGASATVVLIGARSLARAVVLGAVVAGLAVALAGAAPVPAVAMVVIACAGAGKVFFDVSLRTFVQRLLPDRLLTAVFGVQESVMMAGIAVGSAVAPLLVTGPGTRTSFVVAGAFLPLVAVLGWRALRRLDAATVIPADRLALLQGVPMFDVLAARVVERLALFSGTEQRPAGEDVTVEGEVGDLFYVIVAGEVVVSHGADEIRRLGPGEWFGELALLRADAHRTATVTAVVPVDLLTVDRQTFLTALAGAPRSQALVSEHAREHYR